MIGLVVSHDCDCDKFDRAEDKQVPNEQLRRWPVTVAPVFRLTELPDNGLHGDIRGDRVPRYFLIPSESGHDEMVADLWFEQPLPVVELHKLERMATLSKEWNQRLVVQIFSLRSHLKSEDVFKEDWIQ